MSYTHYGNAGIGFNFVQEFKTQQDMIDAFSLGSAYTDVKYGEYIIIGETDADNAGKIYRRGYNLQNGFGGAIYITNILASQQASAERIEQKLDSQFTELNEKINVKVEKVDDIIEEANTLSGISVSKTEPTLPSVTAWINPEASNNKEFLLTQTDITNFFGDDETKVINQKFFTEQIQNLWNAINNFSQ